MDVERLREPRLSGGVDAHETDRLFGQLVRQGFEGRGHRLTRAAGWRPEVDDRRTAFLAHQIL